MRYLKTLLILMLALPAVSYGTASVLQEAVSSFTGGSGTTVTATFASAATVGSTIEVDVTSGNTTPPTVADSAGQNYTYACEASDGSDSQYAYSFYFQNNASATALTVTATWAAATSFRAMIIKEIGGVGSAPVQGSTGAPVCNYQVNPRTASDAITAGTQTPTAQPALVSGFDINFGATNTIADGTGFTAGTSNAWSGSAPFFGTTESKRITSTSPVAATFTDATNGAANRYLTLSMIYTESGGGGSSLKPVLSGGKVLSSGGHVVAGG